MAKPARIPQMLTTESLAKLVKGYYIDDQAYPPQDLVQIAIAYHLSRIADALEAPEGK